MICPLGNFIIDTRNRDEKDRAVYALTPDDYDIIAELKLHMKKFDNESLVSHTNECIRDSFRENREYWDTQDLEQNLSLFTDEHRKNMKESAKTRPPVSLETRLKKSNSMRGKNVGKKQSQEHVEKRKKSLKREK